MVAFILRDRRLRSGFEISLSIIIRSITDANRVGAHRTATELSVSVVNLSGSASSSVREQRDRVCGFVVWMTVRNTNTSVNATSITSIPIIYSYI